MTTKQYVLMPQGETPMQVCGVLIGEVSTEEQRGPLQRTYHHLRAVELGDGRIAVMLRVNSKYGPIRRFDDGALLAEAGEVATWLTNYDWRAGWAETKDATKTGEQIREHARTAIREAYQRAVATILQQIGGLATPPMGEKDS